MLSSMRNAAQGVVGKAVMTVVMGLIIVSFVIWGVGDMLRGFTTSTVASVGGIKISAQEYRGAYDRAIQQYQRRFRRPLTNEEARQLGLDRSILQQLLNEAAVDDEAHKLGLDISENALRAIITSNPNFQDKSGAFDPSRFESALRDMDMNERGFVSELRKQVLRQFIVGALTTGISRPQGRDQRRKPITRVRPGRLIISCFQLPRRARSPRLPRASSRPSTTIASRAIARPNTGE